VLEAPRISEVRERMAQHLKAHYAFYGDYLGVRTARKHIAWYVRDLQDGELFRQSMNRIDDCVTQLAAVDAFFESQLASGDRLQYVPAAEPLAA
jgi:tRNA-dihydrouridine synthase B